MKFHSKLFAILAISFLATSCVDNAYDLNNVNLKVSLGTDGIILPLGTLKELTVDSLVRRSEIDELVTEEGTYAYKISDSVNNKINAIKINNIRDVIPYITPRSFAYGNIQFPELVQLPSFASDAPIHLPSFNFGNEPLERVEIIKNINSNYASGTTPPAGTPISLEADETKAFNVTLGNIPSEVAAIEQLYFSGATQGTPMHLNFSLGALQSVLKEGLLSFTIALPNNYTLSLGSNYGGTATVAGNTLTVSNFRTGAAETDFVFYLARRAVTEPISAARTLTLNDQLRCTLHYVSTTNGATIPTGYKPTLTLKMSPQIGDASLRTNDIAPTPMRSSSNMDFTINGLNRIARIYYIALNSSPSNALTLRATPTHIPLKGAVTVKITLPKIFDFKTGVAGLSNNVLTTTLDQLTSPSGVVLPLEGIHPDDAEVRQEQLTINAPITTEITPSFPSDSYKLSSLKTMNVDKIGIKMDNTQLGVDLARCNFAADVPHNLSIDQPIDKTFYVADKVTNIAYAKVVDAATNGEAVLSVRLAIKSSFLSHILFEHISIQLPQFLDVEHPNLDPATNTIYLREPIEEYNGSPIEVTRIVIKGVRNVPIKEKMAQLKGNIKISASFSIPDNSPTQRIYDKDGITFCPSVAAPVLKISHIAGGVDLDLKEYLQPMTIQLEDVRKSLGDQNIEVNLVAPQVRLHVCNTIDIGMMGNIILQPYDFENQKLSPITIRDIYIQPAEQNKMRLTKLYITDQTKAPGDYTLCHVPNLSNLMKVIPSKIEVTFDLKEDDRREQSIEITGEDYPIDIKYEVKLPLKFKDEATLSYSNVADVKDTFDDIDDYDLTAEDILIKLDARTTIPLDMAVTLDFLDNKGMILDDVRAVVSAPIKGYNAATDGAYKQSLLNVRVDIKEGEIQRLKQVDKIRYTINGESVGHGSGLSPEQYVTAEIKLLLKRGVTIDLDTL
ncbi:MAG: hypothetical protein RRZ83_07155 [Alistipes sp.]